jgi:hypothetical protein
MGGAFLRVDHALVDENRREHPVDLTDFRHRGGVSAGTKRLIL